MQAHSLNNTEHHGNFLLKGFGFLFSSIFIALGSCFSFCASVGVLMWGALCLVLILGTILTICLTAWALTLLLIPVYWLASFFADLDMLCRNPTQKTSWTEIIANLSYNFFFTPFIMLSKCVPNVIMKSIKMNMNSPQSFQDEKKPPNRFSALKFFKKNVFSPFLEEKNFKKKVIGEAKNPFNIAYPHIMLSLTCWLSVTALVLVLEGFFPPSILPSGVFADAIAGLSTPALAGCAAGTVLLLGLLTTLIIVSFNKPYLKENFLHLRVTPEQYTSDVPPPPYVQHLDNVDAFEEGSLSQPPRAMFPPPPTGSLGFFRGPPQLKWHML